MQLPKIFGSRPRTQLLILLALLEESHGAELARLLNLHYRSAVRMLVDLEEDGLVVSREVGRERRVSLNPRYYAFNELKALLIKLSVRDQETEAAAESLRRRPRRRAKPL